jgi:hypothetical protein
MEPIIQKKPFAFELVYEIAGEETLRNVLLTEDRPLELRATNVLIRDDETVILNPVTSVTPDNHHFLLQLRAGLLAPGTITAPGSDWKVLRQENAERKTTDIYLGWGGAAKRLEAGETLPIPLKGLFSTSEARPTLPMLLSWPEPETETGAAAPLLIEPRFPGQEGEYETEAYLILQKVQWGGRTHIPLRLDVVGPYQVLNVESQASTLVLRLTHSAPKNSQEESVVFNYVASQPTQTSFLQLELPVGTPQDRPFALGAADQLNGVTLAMPGFSPARGVTSPDGTRLTFKLTPTATLTLTPGDSRELTLTNLVTSHPSGWVDVDLSYAQVAGFRDGKLTCSLEKTPLVYGRGERSDNIGMGVHVGTEQPDARLLLKTSTAQEHGLNHTDGTATLGTRIDTKNQYTSARGGYVGTRSNHSLHFMVNDFHRATLSTEGHFGIKTTNPIAPLHVNGNVFIQEGRLGIGTTTPAAPLDVNGNVFIQEGRLGIGTTTPAAPLDVHGDLFIKGSKPFVIAEFSSNSNVVDTPYPMSQWIPCLVGFGVQCNVSISALKLYFVDVPSGTNKGCWRLAGLAQSSQATPTITNAIILFIRRELVEDKT